VKVGAKVLEQMDDAYFQLRNTFRYRLCTMAALLPKDQRLLPLLTPLVPFLVRKCPPAAVSVFVLALQKPLYE
jgi:hypothetical protein